MTKNILIAAFFILVALGGIAYAAGSTAKQTVAGFLSSTTTGAAACPSAALTPCFIQYSATNPLPVTTTGH